jgi:hypothetical protein
MPVTPPPPPSPRRLPYFGAPGAGWKGDTTCTYSTPMNGRGKAGSTPSLWFTGGFQYSTGYCEGGFGGGGASGNQVGKDCLVHFGFNQKNRRKNRTRKTYPFIASKLLSFFFFFGALGIRVVVAAATLVAPGRLSKEKIGCFYTS